MVSRHDGNKKIGIRPNNMASGPKNGPPSSRTGTYRKTEGIKSYLRIRGRYEPIESSLSQAKKVGFKGVA